MINKANLRLMVAVIMIVLIGAGSAAADLTDGLVAHWKLDGDANDSAGSNDGTPVNGPVWTTGKISGALEFDGVNDYVSLSNNVVTTTEFTVSGWANQFGLGGGVEYTNMIFAQNDAPAGNNHSAVMLYAERDGTARALIRSSSGTRQILTSPSKNYNEWHHYAMTVDSNDFIFYINGVEVDRTANNQAGNYTTSIDNVGIGRMYSNGENKAFFNGVIDEVMAFDKALSAEEIWSLMHIRPDGEPNLVAYWDFDEGEGQAAEDSSGNDNDGTLGSGPGVDGSDPNWVDSVPPVGICSLEGLVGRNISNVLDIKADILELLDISLGKEEALLDYMDDAFHNGQYDNLNKGDVVQAKQKLHSAIQQEEQAETSIGQSLEKLNDALDALGIDPTSWHQSEIEEEIIRADINADGVVDFRDFTILTEHWLKSYGP